VLVSDNEQLFASAHPEGGRPPLVDCSRLLIQSVYSQLPSIYGGSNLHPRPEDALNREHGMT
jgi:hypothetical protein